ncbi:cannabidiolic acid synthase-like 1 [Gigaspora margarita]|uniref:Cannabidiolic acid synthase-like 1 n=1 Tax=Gigaspora margarita TaxID=4874 RepID=A0A8H3WZJ9_GIGMA|nr:cannabidiolic acid synthase-like 1 [Gigaspora margarita]
MTFSDYNKDIEFEFSWLVIYFPIAFIHPLDEFVVQSAIQCAAGLNIPTVARSGGHSYEGYSLGGGTCPSAGVGGLIMGGGLGYLSHRFGMSSDNILDAQIVLANGTVVYSAKKYPELLWAIRGAGNAGYGSADELRHYVDVQAFIKLSKPKNVTYIESDFYHIEVPEKSAAHVYLKPLTFFFDQKGIPYEGIKQLDNWQCRYYAENFERLVEIKQKYDPYNLFRWNQSIPTTTNISCNVLD